MASITDGPKVPITNWFDYDPLLAPAVVFGILYAVAFAVTTFQFFRYKSWFWICMVVGALLEAIGYVARIFSVAKKDDKGLYILHFVAIFIAPAVMAAALYMATGRVALHAAPAEYQTVKHLWIPPRYMTPLFVICDIAAFVTQVFGGTESTDTNHETAKNGLEIMKIGLIIQLLCFGFFLVISVRFRYVSKRFEQSWPDRQWPTFLMAINISGGLIFVRCIYRLIEFSQGQDGYLLTHEWNFYIFETCFILPVFFIFNWHHPARYLSNLGFRQQRPGPQVVGGQKWYSPANYIPAHFLPSTGSRRPGPDFPVDEVYKWNSPAKYISALRKKTVGRKEQQVDVELSEGTGGWEQNHEGTKSPIEAKTSPV